MVILSITYNSIRLMIIRLLLLIDYLIDSSYLKTALIRQYFDYFRLINVVERIKKENNCLLKHKKKTISERHFIISLKESKNR